MPDMVALQQRLRQFAEARQWGQFHSPKNLVMAISGEVGELNALLQWVEPGQMDAWLGVPANEEALRNEIADVLLYLQLLADATGIDLVEAALEKLAINGERYPVSRARGSAAKYTDL